MCDQIHPPNRIAIGWGGVRYAVDMRLHGPQSHPEGQAEQKNLGRTGAELRSPVVQPVA